MCVRIDVAKFTAVDGLYLFSKQYRMVKGQLIFINRNEDLQLGFGERYIQLKQILLLPPSAFRKFQCITHRIIPIKLEGRNRSRPTEPDGYTQTTFARITKGLLLGDLSNSYKQGTIVAGKRLGNVIRLHSGFNILYVAVIAPSNTADQ